jgi:hypothetical protein
MDLLDNNQKQKKCAAGDPARGFQSIDTSSLTDEDLKKIAFRFCKYPKPFIGTFMAGIICSIAHGAATGVQPYFIKILMDDILKKQDITPLKRLMGIIHLSSIIKGIFMYSQGYLLSLLFIEGHTKPSKMSGQAIGSKNEISHCGSVSNE